MSKRLQIVVKDSEYATIEGFATVSGMTVSEWVRQAIRAAELSKSHKDVKKKLAALDRAILNNFPTGEISGILDEIEGGYLDGDPS